MMKLPTIVVGTVEVLEERSMREMLIEGGTTLLFVLASLLSI